MEDEQRDLVKRFWWVFPALFTVLAVVIWFFGDGRSFVEVTFDEPGDPTSEAIVFFVIGWVMGGIARLGKLPW